MLWQPPVEIVPDTPRPRPGSVARRRGPRSGQQCGQFPRIIVGNDCWPTSTRRSRLGRRLPSCSPTADRDRDSTTPSTTCGRDPRNGMRRPKQVTSSPTREPDPPWYEQAARHGLGQRFGQLTGIDVVEVGVGCGDTCDGVQNRSGRTGPQIRRVGAGGPVGSMTHRPKQNGQLAARPTGPNYEALTLMVDSGMGRRYLLGSRQSNLFRSELWA